MDRSETAGFYNRDCQVCGVDGYCGDTGKDTAGTAVLRGWKYDGDESELSNGNGEKASKKI